MITASFHSPLTTTTSEPKQVPHRAWDWEPSRNGSPDLIDTATPTHDKPSASGTTVKTYPPPNRVSFALQGDPRGWRTLRCAATRRLTARLAVERAFVIGTAAHGRQAVACRQRSSARSLGLEAPCHLRDHVPSWPMPSRTRGDRRFTLPRF